VEEREECGVEGVVEGEELMEEGEELVEEGGGGGWRKGDDVPCPRVYSLESYLPL